jgi:hypothetical protein
VERLIAAGEMHPECLAAVAAAKMDDRWDRACDSPGTSAGKPSIWRYEYTWRLKMRLGCGQPVTA